MNNKIAMKTLVARAVAIVVISILICPAHMATAQNSSQERPNFIIIFTDDQGYGDLSSYGSETIDTPNIDNMAEEGVRLTSFYAQTVCGPSRGALMTARYPTRIGGGWRVNSDEVMIPEVFQKDGYSTGCVGKWDMSEREYKKGLVPNDQGCGYYFGALGANDAGRVELYRNRQALYITHDMASLTRRYTDEAIGYIKRNQDSPFFLYLAHTMAHVVIDATQQFKGTSEGELYGDVVEEIDWNVGRIMDLLKDLGLDKNTYVMFATDNGPWTSLEDRFRYTHGGQLATGSAGPLRSSKGSVYEGGFRVPAIFKGPEIPAGVVKNGIVSSLDVLPTFATLAGAAVPDDRMIDGVDQSDYLLEPTAQSNRDVFYYYIGNELQAVRKGKWKLLLANPTLEFGYVNDPYRSEPELYDLENDISEQHDLKDEFPGKLEELLDLAERNGIEPNPDTHIYATPRD